MLTISINRVPMTAEQSVKTLKEHGVLSGTHSSPDQAVTVLAELLEGDDSFPKGLYLHKVDGNLWLRGYVCDSAYRFPGDALFALEMHRT